jgi:trans-2,3-dihydro-3-hydroxyanthranilate isomerase
MRIEFRLVDVFTEQPLAGNQLCVVPEPPAELTDDLMQAIAREIGFSETTFVSEASGDRYAMRIFTPGSEMPFAGHPSVGTAFVLISEGRIRSPAVQSVTAGEFRVEADPAAGTGWMEQRPPSFGEAPTDLVTLAEVVGLVPPDLHPDLAPQVVSTGLPHLVVPLRNEDALGRAWPDPSRLESLLESLGADGVYLAFLPGDGTARTRMFAPGVGVMEDPATGSAAGPLGAYLIEHGAMDPGRLRIAQGVEMGRPSMLLVDVGRDEDGLSVWVGGGVAIVGAGHFDLPD